MPLAKLNFAPGVYLDDSPLSAEPYYIDADKVRFRDGKPQTIGGWERASLTSLTGICRGAVTWVDNGRNPFAAFGTHLRLYGMDVDGNVTDITPVISRGELSNPFSTTNLSTTVTVAHTAHGLVEGQKVKFSNASAVGGITINGEYTVNASPATNSYEITHSAAATSTAGPGGGTVDYEYFLAPGQVDGLGGLGYGTGGYGSGGYGSSASGYVLYPRTWSLHPWGQNLLANPRGGGLYEWAPNTSATELVTNGSFTGSATGWTLGVNWTYGANVADATLASADLEQNISLPIGAWCLLDFDMTRSAGTLTPYHGSTAIGAAISATGTYKRVFFTGSGGTRALKFTGAGFTGTVDNVSVKVLTTAHIVTNAPTQIGSFFVTSERIVVALGCPDANGNYDALLVKWCDQEDNQDWTESPSNLAGSYVLSHGGRIVSGRAGLGTNLIWTADGVYRMTYVPDPSVVYRFDLIGTGCGLIGPNAVALVGGVFYWMTPSGEFYASDGINVRPLRSTVARDVRDHIAWVQQDKVYAFGIGQFSEVWWLYPDGRDGNECSRYVAYAPLESANGPVWFNGVFDRTAWTDASVFEYPLAVDDDGAIWFQEKGFTQDGATRSWEITTSFFDPADGDTHFDLLCMQPDAEDLQGGYALTITAKWSDARGKFEEVFGPYSINPTTGQIDLRVTAQEMSIKWSGTDAPTFWRKGADRFDIRPRGRRR